MKTLFARLLIVLLAASLSAGATAATVSGNISYSGASTGQIYVVVFTDSTLRVRSNIMAQLAAPGSYTLPGLSDGTYYIVSLMMTDSNGVIQLTDPWGGYGASGSLTPVAVTGGNNVSGINITLVDGTVSEPNPFYRKPVVPNRTIQLAEATRPGKDPSIVYDGSSIYLCKHDAQNAPGAKIFKINPATGDITTTYILSLSSSANGICWMGRLTYHKGAFWSAGGYGDPAGTDKGIVGVFKIDVATSTSSNQLPAAAEIDTTNEFGGIASDGVNLYVGVDLQNLSKDRGVVKFDPSLVSTVPASPFFKTNIRPSYLCYADNSLWVGVDSVLKMNPANGTILSGYNMPGGSAQVYLDGMFWTYDQSDNTLKAYTPQLTGVSKAGDIGNPTSFSLLQNYPNPFNPTTVISYQLPVNSHVTLKVYDLIGREMVTLVNEKKEAGQYWVLWDASAKSSGIYFYTLHAGEYRDTKRMLLVK
jgi:hypothetical protein